MKKNKYDYWHILQSDCGYGWDDLTQSKSFREIRTDLKAYRLNQAGSYRIIKRRVLAA